MFDKICKAYDIGAYQGSYTDFLLSRGAQHVYTFEPNQDLYERLKIKYENNDRVTVYNCLVGDKNEKKPFYRAKYHHTISTASQDFLESSRFSGKADENKVPYEWHAPVDTDCFKLDTIFKNTGQPDFIKIDAEGFESEIISGMTQIKSSLVVTFEIHEEFLHKFKQCINHLHDVGFTRFGMVEGDSPEHVPTIMHSFNSFYEQIGLVFPTLNKEYFGMAFAQHG